MSRKAGEMRKVVQVAETRKVDHQTGEVVHEERTNVIQFAAEPPFVKLYMEDLARVLDLPHGPQMVLLALIRKLDYDGMISLTPTSRERISKSLNVKVVTFNNYLTMLVEREILRRVGRGEYEMNPHLLARGDWQAVHKRRSTFKMTVTYKADGTKTITGALETQEELPLNLPLLDRSAE